MSDIASDSCRIYHVTQYGDILSAPIGSGMKPRCTAAFIRGVHIRPFYEQWDAIEFNVGGKRISLPTTPIADFKEGYPTRSRRGELYDTKGNLCGAIYANSAEEPKRLTLQTMMVVPMKNRLALSTPADRYELSCCDRQHNMCSYLAGDTEDASPEMYRFGMLPYHIDVFNNSGKVRELDMEQILDVKGNRTMVIYGDSARDAATLNATLLLARIITLTGFPANAKPLEVVSTGKRIEE